VGFKMITDFNKNCLKITFLLIKSFKLRISKATLRQKLLFHKDYPSLSSLIEVLTSFGFSCLAVSINKEQLKEIPLPAVGHFQQDEQGYFVLFKQLDDISITILNDRNREQKILYSDLSRIWNGTTLLLERKYKFEESDYNAKHRKEVIIQNVRLASKILLFSLFIGFLFILPSFFLCHMF